MQRVISAPGTIEISPAQFVPTMLVMELLAKEAGFADIFDFLTQLELVRISVDQARQKIFYAVDATQLQYLLKQHAAKSDL